MSAEELSVVLSEHSIELPSEQVAQLAKYCQLRAAWNEKLNLTRHNTYEKFVSRDLVDSLAFAEFLREGESVLDLGTGGGVPGVMLAIVRPDLKVSLSESVQKRAKAVADMVAQLGLKSPVYAEAGQTVFSMRRFDTVVIRAVAKLVKLLRWHADAWDGVGRMLIVKGPSWTDERGEARHFGLLQGLALRKLKSYPLAGTESESVLLQICPEERLDQNAAGESS